MKSVSLVSIAWLLVAAGATWSAVRFVAPTFRTADAAMTEAHDAYSQANVDDVRVRDAGFTERLRRSVESDLAGMRMPARRYVGVAGALRTIDTIQRDFGVSVVRFEPDDVRDDGSALRMTIEVQGSYPKLLGAIAAMSKGPALLRVVGIRVAQEGPMSDSVDAVVHVLSYDRIDMP